MLTDANARLVREIQLLQRCELLHGPRAKPIIDQLVADSDRPLPDVLLSVPQWLKFDWPTSGSVNYEGYWREVDGRRTTRWVGPYL